MKHYKSLLFVFIAGMLTSSLAAQTVSSKDSLMVGRIHQLSMRFAMSPSQEAVFLALARQQASFLDSIGKLHLSPDQRKERMTNRLVYYNRRLKDLLTRDQWERYNKMLQQRREAFIKQAAGKKIKVREVPMQN